MSEPRTAAGRRAREALSMDMVGGKLRVNPLPYILAIEADERRRFVEEELPGLLARALEERLGPEVVWRPLETEEDPWVYYADRVIHALRSMLETYPE